MVEEERRRMGEGILAGRPLGPDVRMDRTAGLTGHPGGPV